MAIIIPFKTRQQLETENAVKVMREWEAHLEWEEANWQKVEESEECKHQKLSKEEISWLNSWVEENNFIKTEQVKVTD